MPTESTTNDQMTFFEHLDSLRPHLVRSAAALLIMAVAAFLLKGFVIDGLLMGPQSAEFPTNRLIGRLAAVLGGTGLEMHADRFSIINTSVAGQFNLHLRVSLATAFVITVPYLLWELWRFVKPALTENEKRGSRLFVFWVSLCFFSGLLFGYFIIVPLALNFLLNYTASPDIVNMIDINSYLSTVLGTTVACGLVFQLPLLVWFLARMGVLSSAFMKKYRRHAIIILGVFSAVITPPDALSMVLVLLPMYGLYEIGIRLAARVELRR